MAARKTALGVRAAGTAARVAARTAALARIVDAALRALLVALVVALVASVSWQVLSRYLLADPSPWTEELARFLLIWIGMLGAGLAFRQRAHLGLELLPRKLAGAPAALLRYFTLLVVALFAALVLIAGGGNLVSLTWELRQYSAVLGIPIAWVYAVIPLTGALIVFYCLVQALEAGRGQTLASGGGTRTLASGDAQAFASSGGAQAPEAGRGGQTLASTVHGTRTLEADAGRPTDPCGERR